ncbi:RNA 2',3'-cyclic phosphodiesterase [Haloechinothrix sp. LS1_15]|uniref:RNA 2',3'-cyclic phosphodiesterase n=1 Tax=Haloechinothrix sp. LS1_15 TaxID=2652248 RepID=UPI0029483FF4|nr:RNA 2',3'-cyclic phosphodiesterase [Haloechinothrix sp. LS1_15]MDV6012145.1 RNA 2',3'-cyclic phosphodiesterase [Haloechinothrix sp. LS1_15]
MRLFTAIVPPREVLDDLDAELGRHGRRASGEHEPLRWVAASLWHVTVAFYGEDDPGRRTRMLGREVAGHRAVELRLDGAGTFPGVLWVGITGDRERLRAVARAAGVDESARPYHPHLTLARGKGRTANTTARRWAEALAGYRGPVWTARELVLMRSELYRDGPRYTEVERFPLATE